jgi:hypothetical protein
MLADTTTTPQTIRESQYQQEKRDIIKSILIVLLLHPHQAHKELGGY